MIALYFCHDNNWTNLFYRGARVWWSSGLHPGSIWSKEQIDDQRDLLSHDMRHWHHQHPIRLRRCYWRYHRQQPSRMRSLLKWTQIPFSHKSNKNTQAKKKNEDYHLYLSLFGSSLFFLLLPTSHVGPGTQSHTQTHTHKVYFVELILFFYRKAANCFYSFMTEKRGRTQCSVLWDFINFNFFFVRKNNPSPPYEHKTHQRLTEWIHKFYFILKI